MRTKSTEEVDAVLRHGTRTGKLATVRADGRPHFLPVWFVLDPANGDILCNTGENTLKGKDLQRHPRLTRVADEEAPPCPYVQIEGMAPLSADRDEMLPWSTAIGGRDMGAENTEAFGKRNAVPGELLVRVRRTKTITQAEVAS